jgi:hypothetical protein
MMLRCTHLPLISALIKAISRVLSCSEQEVMHFHYEQLELYATSHLCHDIWYFAQLIALPRTQDNGASSRLYLHLSILPAE